VRERLRTAPASDGAGAEVTALVEETRQRALAALDDDFNAPAALAALFDLSRSVNTLLNAEAPSSRVALEAIDSVYRDIGGQVLGIIPEGLRAAADSGQAEREAGLIRLLIALRAEARQRKDYALADSIRERAKALGVLLEDGKDGTTWRTI
jgi:cysteinyl-tRNA synthetase